MITIQEIQSLPEITLKEQFEKMALLRAYWQVNDYDNYKSNIKYLLDKISSNTSLTPFELSEKYSKFVKKIKKEEAHKELFAEAEKVLNEKDLKLKQNIKQKAQAEKKAKQEAKDEKINTIKEMLKDSVFEKYESCNYVTNTGKGINKKFNYFIINRSQYNNVIDLIDIHLIYSVIIKEIKENPEIFAILNLSESVNHFGKTTLNKRSFLVKKVITV